MAGSEDNPLGVMGASQVGYHAAVPDLALLAVIMDSFNDLVDKSLSTNFVLITQP